MNSNYNISNSNSGRRNKGDCNSGHCNGGNCNSGNYNSGSGNSGYRNTGNFNSGDCNIGNHNSGSYNSGNYNSGMFNTDDPKMRFFNKDSDITYSEFIKGKRVFPDLKVCSWVEYENLPEDEKTVDTKNTNGKLKTLTYQEAWKEYWQRASEEDKKWFTNLPNFNISIFKEITGIDIEQ